MAKRKGETVKKTSKKFRTKNIDLACILVTLGFDRKVKVLGERYAEFTFPSTPLVRKTAKQFLTGKCTVNITNFMYARYSLKTEQTRLAKALMQTLGVSSSTPAPFLPGETYFFVSPAGSVMGQVYGSSPIHAQRIAEGNAFATRLDAAKHALALKQIN